ncbi:replication initiation protein [Mitsuokella sp.]|uniref:replication initiation protein n=1 Tax=unclassified Mitsuokella TaxID=2637239 RepID=UPI003D7C890A
MEKLEVNEARDIYQSNPLIEARKPLNALEMRLFLLAVAHVNPHISGNDKYYDKEFREFHLTPAEVKAIFGHGEYLNRLERVCDDMLQKIVTVRNDDGGFVKFSIFVRIKYTPKDGLYIKFNEDMEPFLLHIYESGDGYTKISMKQIFNLSSAYAMRLLELMLQYRGTMQGKVITRHIELDKLRFFFDIGPSQYKQIGPFCKYVLDNPIREINEKTQYHMTYVRTKTGRKVTGFTFSMDCRDLLVDRAAEENVTLEALPAKKDRHGLSEKMVDKLTTLCGSNEEFLRRMDYAVELAKTRKVKNVPAFLYKAVAENYRQQDLDMKAAVEREFKAKQENAAWELDALKLFGDKISLDVEETPFDQSDDMGRAMVSVVRKALKERHLNVTAKRLLEDHGMSVARFIELYCQDETTAKK